MGPCPRKGLLQDKPWSLHEAGGTHSPPVRAAQLALVTRHQGRCPTCPLAAQWEGLWLKLQRVRLFPSTAFPPGRAVFPPCGQTCLCRGILVHNFPTGNHPPTGATDWAMATCPSHQMCPASSHIHRAVIFCSPQEAEGNTGGPCSWLPSPLPPHRPLAVPAAARARSPFHTQHFVLLSRLMLLCL